MYQGMLTFEVTRFQFLFGTLFQVTPHDPDTVYEEDLRNITGVYPGRPRRGGSPSCAKILHKGSHATESMASIIASPCSTSTTPEATLGFFSKSIAIALSRTKEKTRGAIYSAAGFPQLDVLFELADDLG
jgi:hypothetical protein